MNRRKPDAVRIERHWGALRSASWLGPARKWWPGFIFHFTDVVNAVKIIEAGKLLCRHQAQIGRDSASSQVIDQTDEVWKGYVRLYFRPRTPTQYRNEGFRPQSRLGLLGAHCPMPVFFLFDALTLLTAAPTKFSDGNLAANDTRVGEDAAFLESIPFEKVYHDGPLGETEKRNIVYHRHAEVLVPGELDLTGLKWIVCRSEAELRTLRCLLSATSWEAYYARTVIKRHLFNRTWNFVETAELEQSKVTLRFTRAPSASGPFDARLEILNLDNGYRYRWENHAYHIEQVLRVRIPQLTKPAYYEARLFLDGAIAFADTFSPETSEF